MSLLCVTNATPPLSVPPKFSYLDFAFLVWYSKPAPISCSVYFSFIFEKQGRRDLAYSHSSSTDNVSTSYSRSLATLPFFLVVQHAGPSRAPQSVQFSSVQALSCVRLFATPWIAAHQASLSITNSWRSPRLMSIKSVMPSSHLILCRPLLLLPPIPPSIRVFSNKSTLCREIAIGPTQSTMTMATNWVLLLKNHKIHTHISKIRKYEKKGYILFTQK